MISHHVYTRICRFCTSVLTTKIHAILGVALALLASPVSAQTTNSSCPSDVYYISDVETSAVAETSQKARAQATSKGLLAAWQRLNDRLLLRGQTLQAELSVKDIMPFLDYTGIVSETVLPSRYSAVFDYCFHPPRVREYYSVNNLRYAELFSEPILVLPIWVGPDGPRLWRKPNPWAEAWVRLLSDHVGLLDLRLPTNLTTERAINVEPLLARDQATLAKAAQLENAERILVMVMTPTPSSHVITINVEAELYDSTGKFESTAYNLQGTKATPSNLIESIDGIASTLQDGIEDVWRGTVVNVQDGGFLMVTVNVPSLKQWTATLDILRSLAPVEDISVIKLASEGGIIRIKLAGSITSLNYALEGHGLVLTDERLNETSFLSLRQLIN
jgi:hypothetical protein